MTIPLFKPSIRRKDMDAVLTCLVGDSIGPGAENKQFIKMISAYLGLSGGIAFREPHRALKTALACLELEDEKKNIIISPLSPGYYADVLKDSGYTPVFADVDQETCSMSAAEIEKKIDSQTGAIILHYPIGFVPETEQIAELNVPVIEDITQSIGSNTGNHIAGSIGRYTLVGTEPENIITTGGGTILLARNTRDLGKMRSLSAELGKAVFLPDMNAALGQIQVKEIERYIASRAEIAKVLIDAVSKSKHKIPQQKGDAERVWYSFPVMLTSGLKNVQQYAAKKHIETAPAFIDTAYDRLPENGNSCPVAKKIILRCIIFPLYPLLAKKNIEIIAKVLATLP